jgi:hypothetical protein
LSPRSSESHTANRSSASATRLAASHPASSVVFPTTQPGLPAQAGLRIAPQESAKGLALSLADGPQAGDQVIEDTGGTSTCTPMRPLFSTTRRLTPESARLVRCLSSSGPSPELTLAAASRTVEDLDHWRVVLMPQPLA